MHMRCAEARGKHMHCPLCGVVCPIVTVMTTGVVWMHHGPHGEEMTHVLPGTRMAEMDSLVRAGIFRVHGIDPVVLRCQEMMQNVGQ